MTYAKPKPPQEELRNWSKDELIAHINDLYKEAGLKAVFSSRLGLTRHEAELLGIVNSHRIVSRDQAHLLMYGVKLDAPEPKILDVYIHRLRTKLKPYSISIQTNWGEGWLMTQENKDRLKNYVEVE